MKMLLGFVLIIAGVLTGLYVGIWWAFIGGIVDVIREIRAPELNPTNVAIGVAKVIFAGPLGWAAAAVMLVPGLSLMKPESP